jgi:hypothetical protein
VRAQATYGAAGDAIMRPSLPVRGETEARAESRTRWLVRHAVVVWLLVVEPVSLALTLDRALPRMPEFGATAWTLVAVRTVLAGVGIAVAGRLRARDDEAWHAVALWACGAIGATVLARVWPELPTNLAPSEARLAAIAAIARDAMLALVAAWLARADAAGDADAAGRRDSS